MKYHFKKAYTRDFSIIMEEGWYQALTSGLPFILKKSIPFVPPNIYYINDGAVEVWENVEAIGWILKQCQKIKEEEISSFILSYNSKLTSFKSYLYQGHVNTRQELVALVDSIFTALADFAIIYYVAINEKSTTESRKKASQIRQVDTFFDDADKAIRASLLHLYHSLKGYETMVLREELLILPARQELIDRKENFVLIPNEVKEIITLQKFHEKNPAFFFELEPVNSNLKKIKGQTAFQGMAKGSVRILKRKDQISTLRYGEVLISPMTTPDFVPAIEKAVAIVTDEGGILCHAAIVSREMRKPCIVGTKIATQVLHDGDLVEVDATNGIVKILSRK